MAGGHWKNSLFKQGLKHNSKISANRHNQDGCQVVRLVSMWTNKCESQKEAIFVCTVENALNDDIIEE